MLIKVYGNVNGVYAYIWGTGSVGEELKYYYFWVNVYVVFGAYDRWAYTILFAKDW